jgi:acyl-CoA thioester hydrolase
MTEDFLEQDNWHETRIRVRYAETDKMGVVYHANYYVWFEIGRTEYCRARGFNYREMEENEDAFLVVVESYCRYKSPAHYDDELIVRTHITELRRRSLRFGYEIVLDETDEIIAEGETMHLITDSEGRVRSFPEPYKQLLLGSIDEAAIHLTETGELVPTDRAPD